MDLPSWICVKEIVVGERTGPERIDPEGADLELAIGSACPGSRHLIR